MRPLLVIGALIALLAGPAPSQELVWRVTGTPAVGPTGGRQIGEKTIGVGDIDHDGYEDLLTIVTGNCSTIGQGLWGYLWLLSGRNGILIREIMCPLQPVLTYCRTIAAAGDMNGDGTADYAAGLVDNGAFVNHRVEVRSGVDDSVLWSVPTFYPDKVLSDLDVDGDGQKDLIVGDEYALGYLGQVNVYSHGGQLLYQLSGNVAGNPPLAIAVCFAKLGDIDNDGGDDFVMGCYGGSGRGANVIVSGRTGAYIRVCYGLPGDNLCLTVDNCGDIDFDGSEDFVASNGDSTFAAISAMRVFSSRTGQILRSWTSPSTGIGFGNLVASRGVDLDGDSFPDFVHGTSELVSPQQRGAIYAYSGRDGSQLHRVTSTPPFGRIGYWVTVLKAPTTGHTGFIVAPDLDAFPQGTTGCAYTMGSISVYSGIPRTTHILGPACPGTLPTAPNIGMQSLGTTGVRVELSRAPAGAPAVLLLGLSTSQFLGVPLPLPIDVFGFPGCLLRTSIDAQLLAVTGATGQDAGYTRIDLPHPIPASGQGMWTLAGQWVVLGLGSQFPGGVTQAITWRR